MEMRGRHEVPYIRAAGGKLGKEHGARAGYTHFKRQAMIGRRNAPSLSAEHHRSSMLAPLELDNL